MSDFDLPRDPCMEWLEQNLVEVQKNYAGEYIAIGLDGVVDHDKSLKALSERIKERGLYDKVLAHYVRDYAEEQRIVDRNESRLQWAEHVHSWMCEVRDNTGKLGHDLDDAAEKLAEMRKEYPE